VKARRPDEGPIGAYTPIIGAEEKDMAYEYIDRPEPRMIKVDGALDAAVEALLASACRHGTTTDEADSVRAIVLDALNAAPARERLLLLQRIHAITAAGIADARSALIATNVR
jgi:hypothetical protein